MTLPPDKLHPLRRQLADEIRARPYELLRAPARISHIAALTDETSAADDHAHAHRLCQLFDRAGPPEGANHFSTDLGLFRFKWERHTEFCTYTFFVEGGSETPFDAPATDLVPDHWIASIPGEIITAVHVDLEARDQAERDDDEITALFAGNTFAGSRVMGDRATVWADFRIHDDEFTRIVIQDTSMNSRQTGRLVQRFLELATYRILALLALPIARQTHPRVGAAERELAEINAGLPHLSDVEAEQAVLDRLSRLAAEAEALRAVTSYRFAASRAYFNLIERRIEDLREHRIEGLQLPGEFLFRRLVPAMDTCWSVAARLDDLSERIMRTGNLLRTRVDVALERQNRDLLHSMNRRARLQLRLQETVEGLSVVAISYYLVGLVGYVAKSLKSAGIPYIDPAIVTGVSVPIVVAVVWLGVRRLRRTIAKRDAPER